MRTIKTKKIIIWFSLLLYLLVGFLNLSNVAPCFAMNDSKGLNSYITDCSCCNEVNHIKISSNNCIKHCQKHQTKDNDDKVILTSPDNLKIDVISGLSGCYYNRYEFRKIANSQINNRFLIGSDPNLDRLRTIKLLI